MSIVDGCHILDSDLLERRVNVLVIGAGGSGSHVIADLAVLHESMLALGHPGGLHVVVMDDDFVSAANVGRARFFESDIGRMKASVLVNRVNQCYGLDFEARTQRLSVDSFDRSSHNFDIVIGCVDTRESRRTILAAGGLRKYGDATYWLDLGNSEVEGQVILGQLPCGGGIENRSRNSETLLPCVTDLYPELLDASRDPKDAGPSCSMAEALAKQSAFVNKAAALHGISMLSTLFSTGRIDHCARYFNVRTGRSSVLGCDPKAWERFGFRPPQGGDAPTQVDRVGDLVVAGE